MLEESLRHFATVFLLVVAALLPIVNPVGSAPIFLALTRGADTATRQALAWRIAVNAFVLLMGSLILGNFVLRMFGLSIPVVQFAGGLVLCWLGIRMLGDDAPARRDRRPPGRARSGDRGVRAPALGPRSGSLAASVLTVSPGRDSLLSSPRQAHGWTWRFFTKAALMAIRSPAFILSTWSFSFSLTQLPSARKRSA